MNALTWPSIALIVVLVLGFIYWLSRLLRRDGANQQKAKNREKVNEMAEKFAKRVYDGAIGTRAWGVLKPGKWKPRTKP